MTKQPNEEYVDMEKEDMGKLTALRKELVQCRKDKEGYLLGWQRCQADAANVRTESDRREREYAIFATEDIIQELTGILTTFRHAFSGADEKNPYVKGFEHIYAQLLSLLERRGLAIIPAKKGGMFDASFHDAIDTVSTTKEKEDAMIMEVAEDGYMLHGKVIKPAKVKVGKYQKISNT
jgi:molecular chaperone GrpE